MKNSFRQELVHKSARGLNCLHRMDGRHVNIAQMNCKSLFLFYQIAAKATRSSRCRKFGAVRRRNAKLIEISFCEDASSPKMGSKRHVRMSQHQIYTYGYISKSTQISLCFLMCVSGVDTGYAGVYLFESTFQSWGQAVYMYPYRKCLYFTFCVTTYCRRSLTTCTRNCSLPQPIRQHTCKLR
jgi:hypothetical protein